MHCHLRRCLAIHCLACVAVSCVASHYRYVRGTCLQAVEQLLEVEAKRGEKAYGPDTLAIGIARLQARALPS